MKIALLGFGKAGRQIFKDLVLSELVTSILVFDPNLIDTTEINDEQRLKTEFYRDVFRFEQSVDLVIIASPDNLHTDYLVRCIKLGIPTFVEKPFVGSETEFQYVTELLSSNPNYKTTCNLVLRTSPLFSTLRKEFSDGTFGARIFVEGKYLYGRWSKVSEGWRGYKDYSVILGGLIHLVDISCYITGNFNHTVSIQSQRLTSKEPEAVIDFAQLSMSSEQTGFFSLTTNFSANVEHRRDISIYGDLSWVEVKGQKVDWHSNQKGKLEGLSPAPDAKKTLISEFIKYLSGMNYEENLIPNLEEIFKVLQLCFGKRTDSINNRSF